MLNSTFKDLLEFTLRINRKNIDNKKIKFPIDFYKF